MNVSVLMITYNQEKFIAQAIESALTQQVNFEYEIVIGEDCSTDRTREIVISYLKQYPDKIRVLLPDKNLGMLHNFSQTFNACRGKYIAILEGDDYWTSPYKLQKQVDFLDNHPECSFCFHNALMLYDDIRQNRLFHIKQMNEFYGIEDLLYENFIPTSSTVFRNGLFGTLPDWFYALKMGDWALHILNAQYGKLGYINEVMECYRIHSGGVWTSLGNIQNWEAKVYFYKQIDPYLNYRYTDIIHRKISQYNSQLSLEYIKQVNQIRNENVISIIENSTNHEHNLKPSMLLEQINNFLNPTLSKDNMDSYLVRISILKTLKEFLPVCKGVFLDVGCGEMPYKPLILGENSKIEKYIGLDIENPLYQQACKPDLFWDGEHISLDDCSVDCAMATEVFEHLPDPETVMREINRVLKPQGILFFTVPFLWSLHTVPHDEYRYTPFALERHLKNAGFNTIKIKALGGWDACLAQMIGLWIRRKPMPEEIRQQFADHLFPFYLHLLNSDEKPEEFTEGLMITGLSGTAQKPDLG